MPEPYHARAIPCPSHMPHSVCASTALVPALLGRAWSTAARSSRGSRRCRCPCTHARLHVCMCMRMRTPLHGHAHGMHTACTRHAHGMHARLGRRLLLAATVPTRDGGVAAAFTPASHLPPSRLLPSTHTRRRCCCRRSPASRRSTLTWRGRRSSSTPACP